AAASTTATPATTPLVAPAAAAVDAELAQLERDQAARRESLYEHVSLNGSSGMLRVARAASGRQGSFRFGIDTGFFSGSGMSCPPCVDPNGGPGNREDDVSRVAANLMLSATPLETVEAYLAIASRSTSNSLGTPGLLQVVGDTTIGGKVFTPKTVGQMWSGGAALDFTFLNGTGSVGISSANVAVHALGTLDFTNHEKPEQRSPWRLHGNVSYIFDNSSTLIEDIETERGQRISRIERYGLNINRLDTLQFALGAEGMWPVVRPFAEYSLDVPVNRQGYTCLRNQSYVGDQCLDDNSTLGAIPSRLTVGARTHIGLPGLALLGALDIAITGSGDYLEETAPETPWMLHFGISYAADPQPEIQVRRVEIERPPPDRGTRVLGVVVQAGTNTTIAGAAIIFEGRDWTGMVTNSQGRFETPELPNGSYSFRVSAESYREGSCSISLPITSKPQLGQATTGVGAATAATSNPTATIGTPQVRCELVPAPRVGNIEGTVVDAKTNQPIAAAKVKIFDKLNRALELQTDARGSFRFERVPEGNARLLASAEKYLASSGEWRIELNKDTPATLSLLARPKVPNVTVAAKELVVKGAIGFEQRSAVIVPASLALVEEIADLLQRQPDLLLLEIQIHGTATGDDALGMSVSRERANALREALIRLGVAGGRLRANGYVLPGAKATPQPKPNTPDVPKLRITIEQRRGVEPPKPPTPPAKIEPAPKAAALPTPAAPSAPPQQAFAPVPTAPTSAAPTGSAAPAPAPSAPKAPAATPSAPAPSSSAPAAPAPSAPASSARPPAAPAPAAPAPAAPAPSAAPR
ncbi:MAG TPA: carboxypeptidase regulatory-like domain-containing protein, partial [Polyangiaceae bacterium]|nr:carboxypeptidase regulatory-like domain-containing protein [Polyangiaceae bacterium]